MKKILITGACGFVGTNFIKSLITNSKENYYIIGIDNLSHGTFIPKIHAHNGKRVKVKTYKTDIRNANIDRHFEDVDYVFHFAGLVSIYDCDKNHYDALDNNILRSVNVLDSCVRHKVKKIIVMETSAVYEDCGEPPYNETQSNPRTMYATSKAMLASLVKSYKKLYNLDYTLLRPFNIYGEFQDWKRTVPPASAGFAIRIMQNKRPIVFGDIERKRDFIHVDDIIKFLNICLTSEQTRNQTFNLGTGVSHSLREMILLIHDILGTDYTGYIQQDEINGEAFDIHANIDKALSIGWKPDISFRFGHEKLIFYLKDLFNAGTFPKDFMDNLNIEQLKIK